MTEVHAADMAGKGKWSAYIFISQTRTVQVLPTYV
jgi:hypothetical protein